MFVSMKKDYWLIAVGAGRWQRPGIVAAKEAGIRVLAVDANAVAPGFEISDACARVDIRDVDAVIAAIVASGISPSGAIAFCNEAGMSTVAAIREHFDLPGIRSDVVAGLTDKGVQRACWDRGGLPSPLWAVVTCESDVPALLSNLGEKVIFKPVDSAGSRGITVLNRADDWRPAYEKALGASRSGKVIIEQFISGTEHTVETFSHRGRTLVLAVTAKKKVLGTADTVASELATAVLDHQLRAQIETTVIKALEALGLSDGPGHTEFMLTDRGEIFLIESAGRGGGFMVADGIVPAVSSFHLSRACALQAVGLEPEIQEAYSQRFAILRFLPSLSGTVRDIRGFDPEHQVPGVLSEPLVSVGQVLSSASSDGDRMAFILSCADSLDEARELADRRQNEIFITVD